MSDESPFVEPGRSVSESGQIIYAWPPEGRFRELWERLDAAIPDAEKLDVLCLLQCYQREQGTLLAFTNPETGEWEDVDWSTPERWMQS